jgi:predicted RNA methylase
MKSRDAYDAADLLRIKKVYSLFKKISDGAHGNSSGFHGSLTPHSMWKIFRAIDVFGRSFADLGAGNGILLSAALSNGASKAHGFELPENKANRYIFKAAMARMTKDFSSGARADLEFKNVEKVETIFLRLIFMEN